jgi:hypothetical protein
LAVSYRQQALSSVLAHIATRCELGQPPKAQLSWAFFIDVLPVAVGQARPRDVRR